MNIVLLPARTNVSGINRFYIIISALCELRQGWDPNANWLISKLLGNNPFHRD